MPWAFVVERPDGEKEIQLAVAVEIGRPRGQSADGISTPLKSIDDAT
jgi:hypothetical protein